MKNNLTEKDIENLNKWAEKYDIERLKIKDKEKIFNLEELHKEIFNLINLEKLSIIINNLEISPDGIEKPINFKSLPIEEIGKLNNLKDLSIRIIKKEK